MSKVLLIKPRFIGLEFPLITQPLGLMYIGSMLKAAGHEPKIHDCALDHKDLHVLRRILREWPPDFIGVSIIITEMEETKKIMELIRAICPEIPVTFGGPWPSANPEKSIMEFGADFVVMGEGELVFPELIDAINRKLPTDSIAGTASWCDGHVKINPGRPLTEDELNQLPFPAWELLDHKLYAKMHSAAIMGRRPYMAMITSRGCPYQCVYCHQTMGKVFRKRSAQSVLSEMEELHFNQGFKEFEIIDDCFNFDRERMIAILTGIRDRLGNVKLHFPNMRADRLESQDMALLKQAGTVSAAFAIETASPRLQKMIRKNLNIEKAVCAMNASVKQGIYSMGYFMIGFPTETYEEAKATIHFAIRSSLHRALFYIPIPFAGTGLAGMAAKAIKEKNINVNLQKLSYFKNSLNLSVMSDDELHRSFRMAYRRFYLHPRRILKLFMHHPRFFSLPRYAFLILIRGLRKVNHAEWAKAEPGVTVAQSVGKKDSFYK